MDYGIEEKKGDELFEAAKKLIFAEYLLDRDEANSFLTAAKQHIALASKQALKVITGLDESSIQSPQITARVITKFKQQEPHQFYAFYKKLQKVEFEDKEIAANALNKVKEFITWVEKNKPARKG